MGVEDWYDVRGDPFEDELLEQDYLKRYNLKNLKTERNKDVQMARDNAAAVNFLDPSTFIAGLTDDVDLEITSAKFEEYDFNGKAQPRDGKSGNVCAIHLTLEGDELGEPLEQFWGCGPIENWQPTDDGEYVEAVGGKSGFYKYSAGSLLINAILGIKGIPKGLLSDQKISVLEGYKFHWNQVPTERKGQDGKDKTLLLPTALVSGPGKGGSKSGSEAKAKAKSSTRKPEPDEDEDEDEDTPPVRKSKPAPAPAVKDEDQEEDIEQTAVGLATRVAENMAEPLTLEDFTAEVFELTSKEKNLDRKAKKKIIELVSDEEWIAGNAKECGVKWNPKKQTLTAL